VKIQAFFIQRHYACLNKFGGNLELRMLQRKITVIRSQIVCKNKTMSTKHTYTDVVTFRN
jgi:hypothetical protein